MQRRKASDFPPEVLKLFDGYVHGSITRREFLDRAAKFAVGGFTAVAMLESLAPNFAWAQQVPKDDPRIKTEREGYLSPQGSGKMQGYLARPLGEGRRPTVIVYHENRGVSPYIEDVTRRLAVEGYLAFAPDALAPVGGYPGDEDKARDLYAKQDPKRRTEDLMAAYPFIKAHPASSGKVGTVGFCVGGGWSNELAVRYSDLNAAVPFYGPQPAAAEAARIKAPMQLHYGEKDERVNAGIPAFEAALKAAGVRYQLYMYPNAQHGFHNETTPRYDEAAAKLAWSRTLAFFKEHLG